MPLQMVLKFREFTEVVLAHAKDYQAELELADKVGHQIHPWLYVPFATLRGSPYT